MGLCFIINELRNHILSHKQKHCFSKLTPCISLDVRLSFHIKMFTSEERAWELRARDTIHLLSNNREWHNGRFTPAISSDFHFSFN